MIAIKTETGHKAFKDRSDVLSPRQRSAFILFDGHRSVKEVLTATAAMGVTVEDIAYLIDSGLLAEAAAPARSASAAAGQGAEPVGNAAAPAGDPQLRYQTAYPIATRLTAGLGLRGFRLNLAIEAATSYETLKALAPKIREAVGPDQFRELERALVG